MGHIRKFSKNATEKIVSQIIHYMLKKKKKKKIVGREK